MKRVLFSVLFVAILVGAYGLRTKESETRHPDQKPGEKSASLPVAPPPAGVPTDWVEKTEQLEESLAQTQVKIDEARIQLERHQALLEEIRAVEEDFNAGRLTQSEYLTRRKNIELP